MDTRLRHGCEILNVVLPKHGRHGKVVNEQLDDTTSFLHFGRIIRARVKHAARHAASDGLRRHEVNVLVIRDAEPCPEQQRQKLLMRARQRTEKSTAKYVIV